MHAPRCLLVPLFAILAAAPVALAPGEAHADWAPLMHRSDIGVDMYLWPTRDVGTAGPVIPFVQFEPTDDLFINLRFPVATWIDPGDDFRAALGNPTFSIWYSDTSGRLTWNAGGRAALPVGSVDSGSWRGSIDAASVAMGLYDVYLWAWDTLPFGGLGGIDWQASRIFALRAGGDVTFYPTLRGRRRFGGAYDTGDFDVVFQGRVDAEFQSNSGAGGGVSLMGWAIPTFRYGDRAQTMIMPYFVYDSQRTFFMRVGGLIALDRPLGPGFDRDRVASLYLQFGGHLD